MIKSFATRLVAAQRLAADLFIAGPPARGRLTRGRLASGRLALGPVALELLATGLLAMGAIAPLPAHAADAWAKPQVVTVVMVDDRFQPDHVTFHAGQPTELRLENHGKEMHEFTAADFFRTVTVRDKRQLSNSGAEIVVQPGKSARVLLVAHKPGDYKLTCADHDWDGMVGSITVE